MNVEKLREDIRDIRIFCGRFFPFAVLPLSYMRIVASESIPTAGVDERGALIINPKWWEALEMSEKRYVALHESLHICLLHPSRCRGFNREAFNIAGDAKINDGLNESRASGIHYMSGDEWTLAKISWITGIDVEALKKMSTEEIARELEHLAEKLKESTLGRSNPLKDDLLRGEVEGTVVQEGDERLRGRRREDVEREWRKIAEKAKNFARQAGYLPAGLERIVDEVLERKPPWELIVRFGIRNHGKEDSSFAYPSRRGDEYPGYYSYHYRIWCLVDCSGSISEEELKCFLGVVKHEARRGTVYVIPWDGEAYEILRADKPADVARRVAKKMRGGGGTVNPGSPS